MAGQISVTFGSPDEIRAFIWDRVNALAMALHSEATESGGENAWEMRLVATGEVIGYDANGYSCSD